MYEVSRYEVSRLVNFWKGGGGGRAEADGRRRILVSSGLGEIYRP